MTRVEIFDCLTDRPCEVCKFHESGRCERWDCVFEEQTDEMTREDAIAKLKNFADHCQPNEEFLMAIKALSAEPCREADGYENEISDLQNRLDIAEYDKDRWKEKVTALEEKLKSLSAEPCEDAINRQAVLDTIDTTDKFMDEDRTVENYKALLKECYEVLPSVTPKQKVGYISIDDAMSVFDDYMCGDIDEAGAEIFLKMLKDKAESEGNND